MKAIWRKRQRYDQLTFGLMAGTRFWRITSLTISTTYWSRRRNGGKGSSAWKTRGSKEIDATRETGIGSRTPEGERTEWEAKGKEDQAERKEEERSTEDDE
jgi:hypothetical protein